MRLETQGAHAIGGIDLNRQGYETCTRGNDLGEPYCATFKEDGVGSSVCEPYEAFKVMFRLFHVVQPVYKRITAASSIQHMYPQCYSSYFGSISARYADH